MIGDKIGNSTIKEQEEYIPKFYRITLENDTQMLISEKDLIKQIEYANNKKILGLGRRNVKNKLPKKTSRVSKKRIGKRKKVASKSK